MHGIFPNILAWMTVVTPAHASEPAVPAPSWRAQEHFLSDFDMLAIGIVLLAVLLFKGVKRIMENQDETR